ncbi:putative 2OG-Fe(II) oxygenase [Actinomadura sp. SCN-SB]|uniref:putative 2OG-Fe(II) oxygenase n=1 Tax=Actinomadura sp. SCN-SB TaxID=3373092 RepID=UPI003753DDB5
MTQVTDRIDPSTARGGRRVFGLWKCPIYQADCPGADEHLPVLRELILEKEKTDPQAADFGGIDAIKSSQTLLTWDHPSIDWVRGEILTAVTALTTDVLGTAAEEIGEHAIDMEGWAVVYRSGGSLRPHTHHDSAWSGVLYIAADTGEKEEGAGYLQMLDPRPAAIARAASPGTVRFAPRPGRMVAFPGWQPHQVRATASDSDLRIAIAWNVGYREKWTAMS